MHRTVVIFVQCIPDDGWTKPQTLILASPIDSSWKRVESSPSHFGQPMKQNKHGLHSKRNQSCK